MPIASPRLRRLDEALASLPAESEAMLVSELDGYIVGLLLCPESIPIPEWMPRVWHGGDEAASPFADEQEAHWYAGLVVRHHDAVARMLARGRGRYRPFLEIDPRHDEVLWELWIEGFAAAVALRPAAWSQIADHGGEVAAAALAGLMTLADIAADTSDLDRSDIDALTERAPDLLPDWIDTLYASRQANHAAPAAAARPAPSARIGRNDPCPCGSGRKSKKCCGAD